MVTDVIAVTDQWNDIMSSGTVSKMTWHMAVSEWKGQRQESSG